MAYRTRSHDNEEQEDTKEILEKLRNQLKYDIYNKKVKINTFNKSTKDESGVYMYE